MNTFKRWNNILGWLSFAIALVVYTLTLEESVSLWDCGEFASAAYKLQVVHPPGAPFFLMVGRLFSLLAPDVVNVGFWINMLSATASAGTVMFTFWITTYFAGKLVKEDSQHRNVLIFAAGLVAALSNTFMDSFWFSAVEAEVYALSSFFTGLTFWAVIRWYEAEDTLSTDRWLVFMAYMIGLALGTHMLNLLVIPVITLAYYFKKFKVTQKGVIYALGAAALALGFVMKVIYPGIPWLLANLDKMFVNGFGLPFYSGALAAVVLIFGAVVYLLRYTAGKGKIGWNTIVLSIGFVILGYSSYAMVIIRSMADPSIDMNDPEDPYKFYGYITREQYGNRPLLVGPYFNAQQIDYEIKGKKFFKGPEGKYEEGGDNYSPVYDPEYNTLFPRMGVSSKPNDARGYRDYSGMDDVQARIDELNGTSQQRALTEMEKQELQYLNLQKPTFGQNLTYFFSYQIRYMYLRYFMWNFVGRFNDQQAVTGNTRFDGNWYSGIPFIDNIVIGSMSELPDYYANQKARNAFYFLPLILGLLGLLLQFKSDKYGFWLVMTLFLFTGVLINVYMNQPPYEPRERDYALVGSFQTFCIWVGLGVISFAEMLKKYLKGNSAWAAAILAIVAVPVNMGMQGWDDHDRSGRRIGIDMAKNFLENLEPNAILFCNGDNDTYPLWYAQNVEGIRTDVRIINQSLLPTEWYSSVLLDTVYKSTPLPLTLQREDLQTGSFDYGVAVDKVNYTSPRPLSEMLAELLQDRRKLGSDRTTWHGNQFFVPVDKEAVIKRGIVAKKDESKIAPNIEVTLTSNYLSKGDIVMYDLLSTNAANGWDRPIYFTSVSGFDFGGLNNYLQLEGLVYRLVPIRGGSDRGQPNLVADYKLWSNLVNNYHYYGMKEKPNFFLDDKAAYVPSDLQQNVLMLVTHYFEEINKYESVKAAVDKGEPNLPPVDGMAAADYLAFMADSVEVYRSRAIGAMKHIRTEIPESVMPMRHEYLTEYAVSYLLLGDEEAAKKEMDYCIEQLRQFGRYFKHFEDQQFGAREVANARYLADRIINVCNTKGKADWANEYKQKMTGI
ncbi:MAG: DUF2723 domain-containing protein [Bacteroidetes bacterium]|nr:DUF2723 domain-containing protein [Bacteroidota bacterium]MDA0944083.1 DUF2723 domain-containing protein [Bacteroidota bacterium]MDA1112610.1 DUF2723 domain-containing protein [Bacteroidota bacterium]